MNVELARVEKDYNMVEHFIREGVHEYKIKCGAVDRPPENDISKTNDSNQDLTPKFRTIDSCTGDQVSIIM